MTGKVFSESANVVEDEAKVLFDYYRQAAEKIVSEERMYEQQIEAITADRQEWASKLERSQKTMVVWAVAAGVSLVLIAVIMFFALVVTLACAAMALRQYLSQGEAKRALGQCESRIAELQSAIWGIRRNYRVSMIGVAYVPVAKRVAMGDKSIVVDYTGEQPETELSLTLINHPDELRAAMDDLSQHMAQMPAVESNQDVEPVDTSDYSTSMQDVTLHDYMGTIDRQVRNIRYLVGDSHDVSVTLPAVPPTSDRYAFLQEYATNDPGDCPIVPVFDVRDVRQKLDAFDALGELNVQAAADGSANIEFFTDVMRELAEGVDSLTSSRTASVSTLTNYATGMLGNVLRAAFDQYSPTLEAEEIERIRTATFDYADEVGDYVPFSLKESSRVHYDIFADSWIADNGSRTAMPFGMHQVDTEVLMPVIQNLMQENRVERLRIYNEIQDQKTDYLARWHHEVDEFYRSNRSEANDLIQRMRESFAEYAESYSNYTTQKATFDAMKGSGSIADTEVEDIDNQDEIIASFEAQASQARAKQDDFESYMERLSEDIDASSERFAHIEFYEASLRDAEARDVALASAAVRDLDARRRRLSSVSAYLAQNASIPPEPNVSERLDADFTLNLSKRAASNIAQVGGPAAYDELETGR